jgi:SPIRAL1-like protein
VAGGTPPSNVNNYIRQSGQNCDNFISDRPSSRVLAPPGGNSSFSFNGQ